MHHSFPDLSPLAIGAMRQTNFQGGELDGVTFIRCAPKLAGGEATRIAAHIREVTGDSREQVTAAHNPEFAEHDYLRVSTDSKAYALICALKS